MEANAVKYDLQHYLQQIQKVQLVTDTVVGIDEATKTVQGRSYSYHYDYLILCMGGEANDFGVAGVRKVGFTHPLVTGGCRRRIRTTSRNAVPRQNTNLTKLNVVLCSASSSAGQHRG